MADQIVFKSPAHPYDPEEAKKLLKEGLEELQTATKNSNGSECTQADLNLRFPAPGQCGAER